MKKSDSDRFIEAYDRGMQGMYAESSGFSAGCQDCLDAYGICCEHKAQYMLDNGEIVEEGHFSWQACDICGSHLGGDRYSAHAILKTQVNGDCETGDGEIVHLEVCVDCVMYMANGDVPEVWEG